MRLPVGLGSLERQRDVRQFPSTLSFSFFAKFWRDLLFAAPLINVHSIGDQTRAEIPGKEERSKGVTMEKHQPE